MLQHLQVSDKQGNHLLQKKEKKRKMKITKEQQRTPINK
jgi:hypothetical protein